jgi:hypothetical protein
MKTLLLGFAFLLVCFAASAQESRTAYDGLKVVTTANGLAAQLSWKKGSEDVSYFVVERSTNGVDFTRCAIVFTSEDPDFVEYKFRDKIASTSQGLVYRLGLVNEQKHICYLPAKTLIAPENM